MGDRTKIEWADATWNPISGCTPVSEGCDHCYASRIAGRFWKRSFSDVRIVPERLELPLRWKKPRRVFVNSMGDLFHGDIVGKIDPIIRVMERANQHTYLILTKRPEDMPSCLWPSNVWVGVSVELCRHQRRMNEIFYAPPVPPVYMFVSFEPLLGPIHDPDLYGMDWVIVGGETGPGARQMDPDWAREIRDAARERKIPFFFKQMGGGRETPPDLAIREFPIFR